MEAGMPQGAAHSLACAHVRQPDGSADVITPIT